MKKVLSLVSMFMLLTLSVFAQATQEVDAKAMAKANNPLASMKALSIQNYYAPSTSGQDASTNASMIRYAQPFANGKILMRATLPTFNGSSANGTQYSGLGGLNVFTTYTFTSPESSFVFGAGPMVTTPFLTNGQMTNNGVEIEDPFADSPWSVGGALVLFVPKSRTLQFGGLITYEHSISAVEGKTKSTAVIQPFMMIQLGKGTYLRSTGPATLDFENEQYYVPLGMGIGKVAKVGSTVVNFYLEPQYTVYSNYEGAANFQLFAGMNFQF